MSEERDPWLPFRIAEQLYLRANPQYAGGVIIIYLILAAIGAVCWLAYIIIESIVLAIVRLVKSSQLNQQRREQEKLHQDALQREQWEASQTRRKAQEEALLVKKNAEHTQQQARENERNKALALFQRRWQILIPKFDSDWSKLSGQREKQRDLIAIYHATYKKEAKEILILDETEWPHLKKYKELF